MDFYFYAILPRNRYVTEHSNASAYILGCDTAAACFIYFFPPDPLGGVYVDDPDPELWYVLPLSFE